MWISKRGKSRVMALRATGKFVNWFRAFGIRVEISSQTKIFATCINFAEAITHHSSLSSSSLFPSFFLSSLLNALYPQSQVQSWSHLCNQSYILTVHSSFLFFLLFFPLPFNPLRETSLSSRSATSMIQSL